MKIDLPTGKKECSIEEGADTQIAALAILRLVVRCKNSGRELPTQYSYYWY